MGGPVKAKAPKIDVIGGIINGGKKIQDNVNSVASANNLPTADVIGDIQNPSRIPGNIVEAVAPGSPGSKSGIKEAAAFGQAVQDASATSFANQQATDAMAVSQGFVSEADRVKQVTSIINAFGAGTGQNRKTPLIFSKNRIAMLGKR
jgi:hypothetical protein